jgi:hypothetical protein
MDVPNTPPILWKAAERKIDRPQQLSRGPDSNPLQTRGQMCHRNRGHRTSKKHLSRDIPVGEKGKHVECRYQFGSEAYLTGPVRPGGGWQLGKPLTRPTPVV